MNFKYNCFIFEKRLPICCTTKWGACLWRLTMSCTVHMSAPFLTGNSRSQASQKSTTNWNDYVVPGYYLTRQVPTGFNSCVQWTVNSFLSTSISIWTFDGEKLSGCPKDEVQGWNFHSLCRLCHSTRRFFLHNPFLPSKCLLVSIRVSLPEQFWWKREVLGMAMISGVWPEMGRRISGCRWRATCPVSPFQLWGLKIAPSLSSDSLETTSIRLTAEGTKTLYQDLNLGWPERETDTHIETVHEKYKDSVSKQDGKNRPPDDRAVRDAEQAP